MIETLVMETRFAPDGISFGTAETLIAAFFLVLLILGAIVLKKGD